MTSFTKCVWSAILLGSLGAIAACQPSGAPGTQAPAAAPADTAATPAAPPEAAPSTATAGTAAPAVDQPPEGVLRAYVWECDDGSTLTMKNLFRENAITLDLHEGPRRLEQAPAASGAKYADETVTFWTRGGTALFEREGKPAIHCSELRAQSILADARLRGVDYRGAGNEPGWLVEAGPGRRLLFVTGFGQERHEYPEATLRGGSEIHVVVYEVDHGEAPIKATFRRAACTDDMSGQAFDHTVVVEFGGGELRGCGTALR